MGRLRVALMGLGPGRLAPVLRLFEGSPVRERLTAIVDSFAFGYHLGLSAPTVESLVADLDRHDLERRGFAYEGAGMGIGIRVQLWPSRMLAEFLRAGDPHCYLIQVGAGWAQARVPVRRGAVRAQLDPVFHWLAWDGFGFHETLFRPDAVLVGQRAPDPAQGSGFAASAFDHGVGRALWFVRTADPDRVAAAIAGLPERRHADLWGGVGLAAAYAGGVSDAVLDRVASAAGPHRAELGIGALLALRARGRAGNRTPHTDRAVSLLGAVDPDDALARVIADEAAVGTGDAAYPALRDRLRTWLRDAHRRIA